MTLAMETTLNHLEDELESVLRTMLSVAELKVRCRINHGAAYILIQHGNEDSVARSIDSALTRYLHKNREALQALQTGSNQHSGEPLIFVGLYRKGESAPYKKRKIDLRNNGQSPSAIAKHRVSSVSLSAQRYGDVSPRSENKRLNTEKGAFWSDKDRSTIQRATPTRVGVINRLSNGHKTEGSNPSIEHSHITPNEGFANTNRAIQNIQAVMQNTVRIDVLSILKRQFQNRWSIIRTTTAGLAIAVLGTGAYALSRPCVIGHCQLLDTAQAFNQESRELIDQATTPEDVVVAYERLLEASYQLEEIPFWSDYYEQAQVLIDRYQQEADLVSHIVLAQRQAHDATVSAQEPPYPLDVWEDIRGQWQLAIAELESIPDNTDVTTLASLKLTEYQTYLLTIDQHIRRERDAQVKITAAREAAQIAEARESAANSAESWNLVYVTWQVVMQRLAEIPKDTMAYAEAQHLNIIYETRLADSKEQNNRERLSRYSYEQATALADEAIVFEQAGQLTQANVAWRNALSNIQQIPEGTSYYEQAQTLSSSYTEELERTESELEILAIFEDARTRLDRACSGNLPLCAYAVEQDNIDIFIEPVFVEDVRELAVIELPDPTDNELDQTTDESKLVALLRTLTLIGDDSGLPMVLYDQNREIITTYDPELGEYRQASSTASPES